MSGGIRGVNSGDGLAVKAWPPILLWPSTEPLRVSLVRYWSGLQGQLDCCSPNSKQKLLKHYRTPIIMKEQDLECASLITANQEILNVGLRVRSLTGTIDE